MQPGTYSFRLNAPVEQEGAAKPVNIPVDAVVMPKATPANLAADIQRYAKIHLGKNGKVRFIDPAIGTGSF